MIYKPFNIKTDNYITLEHIHYERWDIIEKINRLLNKESVLTKDISIIRDMLDFLLQHDHLSVNQVKLIDRIYYKNFSIVKNIVSYQDYLLVNNVYSK